MNENTMNSSFSTLLLLVLKEIRLEHGVHQGHLAQQIGKTPSAWTKIENGQSPLTMDAFFGACAGLQIQPSFALTIVERLVPIFNSAGFYFQASTLGETEDDLLKLVLSYFGSTGYEVLRSRPYDRVSVTCVGNLFSASNYPTVVRYCCEQDFRSWVDDGAKLAINEEVNSLAVKYSMRY